MAFQLNFQIEDKGTISGLNNVVNALPNLIEQSLDTAANDIKMDMKGRTPVASGALQKSIEINKRTLRREIGPSLEYGYYQERGIGSQRRPPIDKIEAWAMAKSLSPKGNYSNRMMAKYIALKIASSGYRAKEFVKKTYFWSVGKMDQWFGQLADKITIEYQRG
ncbi:MAG: hypothetical protein UT24_C0029G0035 [Candidatus Woesebacteria bacterium GW2011_GWB1_39_12]|uniref:HK97 gp10 family phage protein n=1 Tax=Candidatus Woesebacteria bacterium GW2011_GWB1_39_12 TaxID=1618574 RepID=A0A0G0M4A5_9BACT|nr:MAG: hypothetical protein UT24_C0029G0035 [Candidatus Woesebacteria bacterium GW2011_GWB1_39_12]